MHRSQRCAEISFRIFSENIFFRPTSAYWWLTGKIIVICLDKLSPKLYRRDSTKSTPSHPKTSKEFFYALSADKSGYEKWTSPCLILFLQICCKQNRHPIFSFHLQLSVFLLPRCWLQPIISNLQRTEGRPRALNLMADCTQYKYSHSCEKCLPYDLVEGSHTVMVLQPEES